MTIKKLTDTFYLKRAGRYASPLNSADRLPVVYGDLTDGTLGNWVLPEIDTTNYVYAFAGHEVLSVANGNNISIYENDLLLDPSMYVFNEANDYEGLGVIATIDFATPKTGSIITARGMGKPTTSGGAVLMENIIDIIVDLMTVENDWTAANFEGTAKERARQLFTAQSYKAAGAIVEDAVLWDIVTDMLSSFLGSAWLDGNGYLVLDIDTNTIAYEYGQNAIFSRSDTELTEAIQRLANIINQCPCNYSYNYVVGEFRKQTNDTAHADAISQGIYGVREPNTPYQFYWCRDLTSVQKVQDLIVAKFKDPLYEITIMDATPKHYDVDVGAIIIFSADSLYGKDGNPLRNHFWRVLSVQPDLSKMTAKFRTVQTEYYLTAGYFADGSYLADGRIFAGANRDMTVF